MLQPDETRASQAWQQVSHILGIRFEAPFVVRGVDQVHHSLGYFADFGGPGGIVLFATRPPDFVTPSQKAVDAQALGLAWTFLNVEAYDTFDEKHFADTLRDWGYTGAPENRPRWI